MLRFFMLPAFIPCTCTDVPFLMLSLLCLFDCPRTFDRLLDSTIRDEQRQVPLRLPNPSEYK